MALVRSVFMSKVLSTKPFVLYNAARKASHTTEDLMPGPYPKTEKERLAAAKKYGLLPHEYEPYPDDGMGCGDYPKLPDITTEEKDPYYPWDLPEYRRNFGECWHVDFDTINDDRFDGTRKRISVYQGWFMFMGTMSFFALFFYGFMPYPLHRPAAAKQYPSEGVHYSFERGHD